VEQRANHHSEYPRTVTEAVDWLESIIPAGELELIAAMDVDDVVGLHVELGAYIRERLGLWNGNDALMEDAFALHAVDASMVIVMALWQRVHQAARFCLSA
jgi:hypothetical protein